MADTARDLTPTTLEHYRRVIPYRDDRLFTRFLPTGYEAMTLSSVPLAYRALLTECKIHLGMFITLLDDFADNPRLHDARLLEALHATPFDEAKIEWELLGEREREVVTLARELISRTLAPLEALPNHAALRALLEFDVRQFLNANHFSSLMTRTPALANGWEMAAYGPHNMGIIAIGTMDLMSTSTYRPEELGRAREVLAMGQRFGRLCNMLVTRDRELAEGDVTSEALMRDLSELEWERDDLLDALGSAHFRLESFSVPRYRASLLVLKELHESMEGIL